MDAASIMVAVQRTEASMNFARIVVIALALVTAALAGCQTDGAGASYNRSSSGSSSGGGAY
jgi:hypothetical protein